MRRSISYGIIIILALCSILSASTNGYKLDIIESNDQYLICDINFDSLEIVQRQIESSWYSDLHIKGCAFTDSEGLPKLPVSSIVFGIPVTSQPQLKILSVNSTSMSLGKIVPVEKQDIFSDMDIANSPIENISDWYPQDVASLGMIGNMRDQKIAQIELSPVMYHFSSEMIKVVKSIRLRLDFAATHLANISYSPAPKSNDKFESVYSAYVANYADAKKWKSFPKNTSLAKVQSDEAPYKYKLYLQEDGLYRVTGQDLKNHGVDLNTIEPATLAISNKGGPVPIMVEGWSDNSFDEQDRIIFIGQHNSGEGTFHNYYSETNVYILSWGASVGARIGEVSGIPTEANPDTTNIVLTNKHLEYDVIYERLLVSPDEENDHWFWKLLTISEEFPLRMPTDYLVPEKPMRIRINMQGLTYLPASPDHRVYVKVNEQDFGEARWDNQQVYELDTGFIVPEKVEKDNEIKISLPGGLFNVGIDNVLLNWIDIDFYEQLVAQDDFITFTDQESDNSVLRIDGFSSVKQPYVFSTAGYTVTNTQLVKRQEKYSLCFSDQSLNKGRYYVATEDNFKSVQKIEKIKQTVLKTPTNGADYIIITHPDFMSQAQKLADYRSSQNLRTFVVDIFDIYNEFNDGLYSPIAIHSFVKYAYENWVKPAPLYLLLLGDTTHRMDKNSGDNIEFNSYVPTMMQYTFSWGMTSSDNYFVAVSGDDFLPDLFIGRIPANNSNEASIMVQKVIDYESSPVIGDWRRNVFLLSGNNNFFEASSQYLYDNLIPKQFITNRLSTMVESDFFGSTEDVAGKFNSGQSIVNFIGHGGGGVFFDSQLFLTEDIDRLENKNKYAVAFSMTCFIGHFDNPDMPSLAEELLKAPDKGIAAHFGSAGRAYLYGDFFLNNALFDAVFNQKAQYIGEIATLGKLGMVNKTQGYFDHVKNYILMGDPAMRVKMVKDNMTLLLSRDIVKIGDDLVASGTIPGAGTGTAIVSIYNHVDSLLQTLETPVQNGQFSKSLFTVDENFIKNWPDGGGKGYVRVYFTDGINDDANIAAFVVNQPNVPVVTTLPETPSHLQDFLFQFELDQSKYTTVGGIQSAELQWSINGIEWISLQMLNSEGDTWVTETTIQKTEGTTVYYRLLLTANDGSKSQGEVHDFRVEYRPDLYFIPESITISGTSTPILSATLRNNGGLDTGEFSLGMFTGNTIGRGDQIGNKIIIANLPAKTDTVLSFIWEQGKAGEKPIYGQVDLENQILESNESNNLTQTTLRIVTTQHGSGGVLYAPNARYFVELGEQTTTAHTTLLMKRSNNKQFLDSAEKLSLVPIFIENATEWSAFNIQFGDSLLNTQKPIKIGAFVNKLDSLTAVYLAEEAIRIYGWNGASESWNGFATTQNIENGLLTAFMPEGYTTFALLASGDTDAPLLHIAIEGQNFVDGDLVSKKPSISIQAEDESGFDISNGPIKVLLNDEELEREDFTLYQDPQLRTRVTLTFSPELTAGEHTLKVEAYDINGNAATEEISMAVAGEFGLAAIANHPNPFPNETVIAFTLTDIAEDVTLGIYTVSGRLIRSFTFSDISGYHEQEWDGFDDFGNEVANGVYYLKFVAQNGDKKIEKIEKMAKLQ